MKYDYIYSFENGVTIAQKNGQYCIIDENDNLITWLDSHYHDVRSFRNGYATMKDQSDKWGAIDNKGNEVIPCQYDSLVIFYDGVAKVKANGKEFKIDTSGKVVP